ncbi:LysR family transcriptional regulator [Pseudomonas gingeri]|uniref:LysR family transcriptional regulator n=1 Tax=Pseudomonas gingeri TaxID=117681 RepID=UPI0015A452AE|nr:LysR family transcriptional regulator [Pseudomonas gingeri]NVZ99527.1 LysR family transcriptional regulator [Pseudomonas gingeri]NWA15451.1 LysR family transcriptional regulator [Pseudomonas gingeri]NWA56678.1 LysR family transcriptional regulator [Pseudomonas gingeri]NWA95172.1 LysR family transcriptional regulator [Pseudomonas gingeri]NWB05254.1 LysR family transcriptional regulator [Pseudomonas gingeri]
MSKLRQMEVFVAVVEAGSFADAAPLLGMSAVMVGRHIQHLEQALKVRLIQRTTRRQTVTAEGRLFYEEARLALEQVDAAFARLESSSDRPGGLLRITAPMTLGVALVAPLVAAFMQAFEDVQVELILGNEIIDLQERAFDLAFRVSESVDVSLMSVALAPYQMLICASPDYLARQGTPLEPADLSRHRILTHTSWHNRFAWPLTDGTEEVPWPEKAVLKSNDGQVLLQAALAGNGILMQPDFLVAQALAEGRLVRLLDSCIPAPKPVHMVYPRSRTPVPKLEAFVGFVSRHCSVGQSGTAKKSGIGTR